MRIRSQIYSVERLSSWRRLRAGLDSLEWLQFPTIIQPVSPMRKKALRYTSAARHLVTCRDTFIYGLMARAIRRVQSPSDNGLGS